MLDLLLLLCYSSLLSLLQSMKLLFLGSVLFSLYLMLALLPRLSCGLLADCGGRFARRWLYPRLWQIARGGETLARSIRWLACPFLFLSRPRDRDNSKARLDAVSRERRWCSDDPNALGDWKDTYAELVSARAEDNCPENWEPLWGWPAQLPSASQVKAKKRQRR